MGSFFNGFPSDGLIGLKAGWLIKGNFYRAVDSYLSGIAGVDGFFDPPIASNTRCINC
jgi:hypothetical protein